MKVEGVGKSAPVEPVRPDIGKTAGDTNLGLVRTNQGEGQKERQVNIKEVEKAIDLFNETMKSYNTELQFTLHKSSGEYVVKIINTKDHTVIREIPPERVLDMVAHFKKMLGLIVDKFI
ncbi:MAG: flagellar protein FlaG [Actinobacteria bacterium]|nr:flagellar protein FlaG [Actinomycetota bacterium]